jgi:RNA polymerase sigma-70 factor, ECF subfamily
MEGLVSDISPAVPGDLRIRLVELYDTALDEVFGYLVPRCGSPTVAEDLTSETFLAAADAVQRRPPTELTVAWLIGIARHKLADHWRRTAREARLLTAVDAEPDPVDDEWDVTLDAIAARRTLTALGSHHRGALTLRYVDGLPVRDVAECLGRTEKATEVLLVRARAAFRTEYELNHREEAT